MVWFIVDDKFHGSEEVMSIPLPMRSAAIGLWTLAGAWSSDHLKDGYVPRTHLENWGGTVELADALVRAKLWTRVTTRGYQFRNWAKWQKTRADVEDARKAERDRKAEWRRKKAENTGEGPQRVPRDTDGSPDTPSLPSPSPTEPDLKGRPSSHSAPTSDDSLHNGDNPVDDYPALIAAARAKLVSLNGSDIEIGAAGVVVDRILERGGKRVRNPRHYVLGVLRDHGHEWLNYIHSGKEPE